MVMKRKMPPPLLRETATPAVVTEIPAGEFKARCLALMDEVAESGGEYLITKRGVPVARLVPASYEPQPLLGSMAGTAVTLGDIVSPLDEAWGVFEDAHGEE